MNPSIVRFSMYLFRKLISYKNYFSLTTISDITKTRLLKIDWLNALSNIYLLTATLQLVSCCFQVIVSSTSTVISRKLTIVSFSVSYLKQESIWGKTRSFFLNRWKIFRANKQSNKVLKGPQLTRRYKISPHSIETSECLCIVCLCFFISFHSDSSIFSTHRIW